MSASSEGTRRGSVLTWTLKTAALVAVLSYGATAWLSGPALESGTLSRVAAAAFRGTDEPVTTGSIARSAGGARLDPCGPAQRP
jgi:hypothetical protein